MIPTFALDRRVRGAVVGTRQTVGAYILTDCLPMGARAHVYLEFDAEAHEWWAFSAVGAFLAPIRLIAWHQAREATLTGRGNAARENPERPL